MATEDREPELRTATLDEIVKREPPRPDTVTAVIRQIVKPDATAQYEQWLRRVMPVAARFPGHRGVNVIHPGAGTRQYTIIIRFDSLAHAQDWFGSDARRQLVDGAASFLDEDESVETRTGLEFWFHPPAGQKPAKRYKQFLLTLSVIYPLTMLVPAALCSLFDRVTPMQNHFVEHFIASAAIVGLMVYVIMPRYTRLMSRWLYA